MQLSKIRQGLAVSAVSALAITGLVMTAPSALAAEGAGVRLLSQQNGIASIRRDADFPFGDSVTITAQQLDPNATITFEFNADPEAGDADAGWAAVQPTSSNENEPYVAIEWIPASELVGTSIALRAVSTIAATDESPATATYDTRNGVALSGEESPVNAVSAGTVEPFFAQPYADSGRTQHLLTVTGTTSATEGTVELTAWNPAVGTFQGRTEATVEFASLKTSSGFNGFVDGGRYTGVLDIATFDAGDGDSLAVRAERDSDSVFPVILQAQTIASIAADEGLTAGPDDTTVPLRVIDQVGRPILGAEVRRSSDDTLVGYTDAAGRVTTTQTNSTTESYYANATDVDAYEADVDFVTEVSAPDYVPVLSGTEAVLADGAVFDDREYAAGDIALQLVDDYGQPFASEEDISYSLHPSDQEPSAPTTATTDANGRLVVPFDPTGADGEYTLAFTEPATIGGADEEPVTFVAGDAVLGLTPLAGTAPSGGQIAYAGTLTVEGEPLAGRAINLGYTRGTEQAPGAEADAALLVDAARTLEGAVNTDTEGAFTVTVADLVETGGPAETGGRLKVTARGLGDMLDATADFTHVVTVPPTPTPTPTPTPLTPDPEAVKGTVSLRLAGFNAGDGKDGLRISGPTSVGGERIRVHVRVAGGYWKVVKGLRLDAKGDASLTVRDTNGDRITRYRVRLLPNALVKAFTSKALRLR